MTSDQPIDGVTSAEPSVSPPSAGTPPSAASAPSAESPPVVESNLLKVSSRPNLAFEGGAVRTTIRVGRDSRNRVLRLSVDGERFGASSEFWLDGADAAIVHERIWPTLPAGVYEVRATVERNDGTANASRTHFQVIGRESASMPLEAGQAPVGPAPGPAGTGPVTAATPF